MTRSALLLLSSAFLASLSLAQQPSNSYAVSATNSSGTVNANIYSQNGFIGFGTFTPRQALDVHGAIVTGNVFSAEGIYVGGDVFSFNRDPVTGVIYYPPNAGFTFHHTDDGPDLENDRLYFGIYAGDGTNVTEPDAMVFNANGDVGFGSDYPQGKMHIGTRQQQLASTGTSFGNGNLIIQAYGPRSTTYGSALTFANSAQADSGNTWEEGRIMSVSDDNSNGSATGRLYLQTRYYNQANSLWDWRNNLVLTAGGYVGINTTTPSAEFELNGNMKLTAGGGGSITFPDGTNQATAWNGTTSGGDYAESVEIDPGDSYVPGEVIMIDTVNPGHFVRASQPYSTLVAGVYSTKPGLTGRRLPASKSKADEIPMAMIGIVPVKVSAENGPIHVGDLLVSSGTPGVAMRGTDSGRLLGAVIGKSLGNLDAGSGQVEVLLTLQ